MRLTCHYCAREGKGDVVAQVTVHDPRRCLHVCWDHAMWRMTTSGGFGHSLDCPYHESRDNSGRKP